MSERIANGYGDRVAQAACERFEGLIRKSETAREQAIRETMQGIGGLAAGFAPAMVAAGMPVERVAQEVYDNPATAADDREPRQIAWRRHPLWVVVRGTDLSGRPLRAASIHKESNNPRSLGYVEVTELDPAKAQDYRLDPGETVYYFGKAIAVSALGELLKVRHTLIRREASGYRSSKYREAYRVLPVAVQPADLFDVEGKIKPERIISEMKSRLDVAVGHYQTEMHNEQREGPVYRDAGYYDVQERPVAPPKAKVHEERPKGHWAKKFGR